MGRKFALFEVVVHFTEIKSKTEIQVIVDNFYLETIESALTESALSENQKCEVLDRIASYHKSCANSRDA